LIAIEKAINAHVFSCESFAKGVTRYNQDEVTITSLKEQSLGIAQMIKTLFGGIFNPFEVC
jgi:hypothetical protein